MSYFKITFGYMVKQRLLHDDKIAQILLAHNIATGLYVNMINFLLMYLL